MKIPDPKKTKVVTAAKAQPLGTSTAPTPFVVKGKLNGHVDSIVNDEVPVGLVCIPFMRVSSPRTGDGASVKRQEELILEAASLGTGRQRASASISLRPVVYWARGPK